MKNPYFNLISSVWHYGSKWRHWIVLYYITYVVAQAFYSVTPYTFGRAVDVLQHFTNDKLNEVIYWLLMGVLVLLGFWILHGPARILERNIALKIQQTFRLKMYKDMTYLPLKWHQDHHSGNITTRINRAATSLYRFAGDQFIYIEAITRFVMSIGFLFWICLPVGIVTLITSAFVTAMVLWFDRHLIPLYDKENEIDNHVGAVLYDYVSNMTTVLTLRLGELTHSNLFQRMMSVWPTFKREVNINEVKWFALMMLLSIAQAIILIGYIIYTLNTTGTIMIGIIVMIFRYQYELNYVFYDLSVHYGEIVRMNTDVGSAKPIIDDIKSYAHLPKGISTARNWHTLEINNLEFHHSQDDARGKTFNNITFKIKRGEKVALIGYSGGGKSTLLNILCGLYTPNKVTLKIDEVAFDTLEPLQAITTLIPQDPEIFENTILFNIAMDLPIEANEINQVIESAGFSKVLATLPEGLNTDIREKGLNLSVGQKQRLALARGLFAARYSSLILMDEPTSSVDLPTEKEILANVITNFPDSALIISLHRLHLLPKFDSIIMLQNGVIIDSGSTQELLSRPGPVKDLWLAYQ